LSEKKLVKWFNDDFEQSGIKKAEITVRLSGIIFKKALMEDDFLGIYSKVFEKIESMTDDEFDTIQVLEIFGDIGG
jgi:hypothetical protein